jgi:hypothetical protein
LGFTIAKKRKIIVSLLFCILITCFFMPLFNVNALIICTKYGSNPILTRGAYGAYDYSTVRDSALLKVGSFTILLIQRISAYDATSISRICLANSTDLITWNKMA